jgi:hypothetical protein
VYVPGSHVTENGRRQDIPAVEKPFHFTVIGFIAKFIADDPHNLSIVNRWVELLKIENVVGDRFWKAAFLLARRLRPLVNQT